MANNKNKYTILFVEDTDFWVETFKNQFEQKINFLHAETIERASIIFREKANELDMIIISGREEGNFNTLSLVEMMRKYYSSDLATSNNSVQEQKVLMAAPASESFREKMVEAGCNLSMPKCDVEGYLRMMLKDYIYL